MTDWDLIGQYVQSGSEAAFSELVRRHIDMVHSVCMRRLHNREDAKDATQAVFIALASKGAGLRAGTNVAGWLYRAAGFVAGQVLRKNRRRKEHEMAAATARTNGEPDNLAAGDEVDHVLAQLNSGERHAIVLRYLEGRSFREVAAEMSLTEEAARKRVSRALDHLRSALRPATAGAVSVAVVEQALIASVHPAPPGLISITTKAAIAGGAASTGPASLAKGAALAMTISKAKTVAIAAAVLLLAGSGAVGTYYVSQRRPRVVSIDKPGQPPAIVDPQSDGWQIRFYQVYSLQPGQAAKVVIPPPARERAMFFLDDCRKKGMPGWQIGPNELLSLEWDGTEDRWHSIGHLGTLAGGLLTLGLKNYEIDSSIPANLPFPGDWIFRKDSTAEQRMQDVAKIVSQKLGREVHFERRMLPRPVLVVSGTYPEKTGVVEMTDGISKPPRQDFPQQGSLDNFLSNLAERLGYKLENHVPDPGLTVRWHDGVVKPQTAAALMKNLNRQTSLNYSLKTEPVDVWCMVEGAPSQSARR